MKLTPRPELNKKIKHDIDVVVDRIVIRPDMQSRLADSFETALAIGDGIAVAEMADDATRADYFFRKIRLPGFRLHHNRDRAAAIFVQQSVWRLPGL